MRGFQCGASPGLMKINILGLCREERETFLSWPVLHCDSASSLAKNKTSVTSRHVIIQTRLAHCHTAAFLHVTLLNFCLLSFYSSLPHLIFTFCVLICCKKAIMCYFIYLFILLQRLGEGQWSCNIHTSEMHTHYGDLVSHAKLCKKNQRNISNA